MELTSEFDVIEAATDVVEGQLTLLEALCDANKYRMDESSRLLCRCPSCRGENVALAGWLWAVRHPEPEDRRAELLRQYRLARRN
jgi:hypothetical protein